jgi:hypothetical protein
MNILFYSILFYSILFYSILFYSILFYSILFYSILQTTVELPVDRRMTAGLKGLFVENDIIVRVVNRFFHWL